MKKRIFCSAAISAALVLGGCSGSEGSPREGQYQQTIKITELDFPGITGDAKAKTIAQMEQATGGEAAGLFCMKGADGGRQWKQAASQMASALGGECKTIKDEGSATRIDLKMKCTGTAKGDMAITMTGTSQTEGYESAMSFDMNDPASNETARLAMKISAKRIGECKG